MNEVLLSALPDAQEGYTSLTAPGIHDIDPASLIWPYENEPNCLMGGRSDRLAVWVHRLGASDLDLQVGQPAKANIHGRRYPVMTRPLTQREVDSIAVHVYGIGAAGRLADGRDFRVGKTVKVAGEDAARFVIGHDRTLSSKGDVRYRFRWQGASETIFDTRAPQLTARIVNMEPPTEAEMGLEPTIIRHWKPRRGGLILIVGQPAQGKTYIIAGVQRSFLEDPDFHGKIIELAEPQEYLFDGLAGASNIHTVSEIGPEGNYKLAVDALNGSMSRAPSAIVMPEMITADSIRLALMAARAGVCVYATMHATDVASTIPRAIATFPYEEQNRSAFDLLRNIRLVVHCQLVRGADGRRVQLREFLPFTPSIRRQIAKEPYERWGELIEGLVHTIGQSTMQAAEAAVREGRITQEEMNDLEEERI